MKSLRQLRESLDSAEVNEIAKRRRLMWKQANKRRWSRFAEDYPGMPHYSRNVTHYCLVWLEARRKAGWECSLAEIVHYLRKDALAAIGEDADQIQDRGVARIVRAMELTTWRSNDGLQVRGLRPR